MLRTLLEELGTERAQFYRPHDLRREHAEDLRLAGTTCLVLKRWSHNMCVVQAPHYGRYWQPGSGGPRLSWLI